MLDAETKRRIGVLGRAALSSLAQRSTMLPPPSQLNSNAELSMGLRPRLSAAAASRLHLNPQAGARGLSILDRHPHDGRWFWGECPAPGSSRLPRGATCGRRIRGFLEPSGWRPGIIFCLPIPTRPRRRRIAPSGVFPAPFPVR